MFLILINIIQCILSGIKTKDKRTFLRPHCRINFDGQCFQNILPTHKLHTCGQRAGKNVVNQHYNSVFFDKPLHYQSHLLLLEITIKVSDQINARSLKLFSIGTSESYQANY